jgi:hypothetical protein
MECLEGVLLVPNEIKKTNRAISLPDSRRLALHLLIVMECPIEIENTGLEGLQVLGGCQNCHLPGGNY